MEPLAMKTPLAWCALGLRPAGSCPLAGLLGLAPERERVSFAKQLVSRAFAHARV